MKLLSTPLLARELLDRLGPKRRRRAAAAAGLAVVALIVAVRPFSREARVGEAPVRKGTLVASVPFAGILSAERADSYAPEVPGVELKILALAPEGTLVAPGDVLIEFDSAPFEKERETAAARAGETAQEAAQARAGVESARLNATADVAAAAAAAEQADRDLGALSEAELPLTIKQSENDVAQRGRDAENAKTKLEGLAPFVAPGYISQEEYRAAQARAEQAAQDLELAKARHAALVKRTLPDLLKKREDEARAHRLAADLAGKKAAAQIAQAEAAAALADARHGEALRQLAEAKRKIERCRVTARAPGLVVHAELFDKAGERRKVRVGDGVWGGTPVVTLPDLTRLLVEGRVPESEIHRLKSGLLVDVRLDAFPSLTLRGKLRSVGTLGASEKNEARSFPVSVVLDRPDVRFRPGMAARCSIVCEELTDVVYIPIEAVREEAGRRVATVVTALGRVERREVVTGRTTSSYVEIVHGLTPGEVVRLGEP